MPIADKKRPEKIFEKTNANSKFFLSNSEQTKLSASYADVLHLSSSHWFEDDANKAVLYQLQLIEEDIDEIRRHATGSGEISVNGGSF